MTIVASVMIDGYGVTHKDGYILVCGGGWNLIMNKKDAEKFIDKLSATIQDMEMAKKEVASGKV